MPLEHERAFSAESPVGRYWLRNCVGFHVEGLRGGAGTVEEVGLGADGVDVLSVRRHNVLLPGTVLVPTQRVESVRPWEDTIVLESKRRHATGRRTTQAHEAARRLRPVARAAVVEIGRVTRDGAIAVARLLAAFGTLLWGLAVLTREQVPHARRHVSSIASSLQLISRAYAEEGGRIWRTQREALASRQQKRGEPVDESGDNGPLTRAGDDEEAAARRRETLRRR